MIPLTKRSFSLLSSSLLLAGCSLAPHYEAPTVSIPAAYKEAAVDSSASQDWKTAQPADDQQRGEWWTVFNDPTLNALEQQAIAGNQTGYLIGRKAGPAIFNKPDSRLFKQEYVDRTSDFFERHGGKAVTLAQFVPIVRTFTPVIAGVGKMHYRHFITFNILGATFWAFAITWLMQ